MAMAAHLDFSLEIPMPAQVTTAFQPSTGPLRPSSSSVSPEPPPPRLALSSSFPPTKMMPPPQLSSPFYSSKRPVLNPHRRRPPALPDHFNWLTLTL
jgi:hypothetical protein